MVGWTVRILLALLVAGMAVKMGWTRAMRFAGYAAIFDRPDRGGDVVRPGAFAASLSAGRERCPCSGSTRRRGRSGGSNI